MPVKPTRSRVQRRVPGRHPSGNCALLNDAAFEQVREPGKNLVRNSRIERVG